MAEESQQYDLRAIRQLLLTAFTAEELHDLFYFSKTPELREVPNLFAPGDGYPTMVRKAVRYCDSHFLVGELLAEVKEANPRAYEKFGHTLRARPAAASLQARPKWLVQVLSAGAVVILILFVAVLVLVLRGCRTEPRLATATPETWTVTPTSPASPPPTATATPTATFTSTATDTPTPSTFEPASTTALSPTASDTPTATDTAEPLSENQFKVLRLICVYGPGLGDPIVGTVDTDDLLSLDGVPQTEQRDRQWPVRTRWLQGWVHEWTGDRRLIKPYMDVGDTVVVVNPIGTGDADLWVDCANRVTVSRGTELTVIGRPDPTQCGVEDEEMSKIGVERWLVETPDGTRGWIADFTTDDLRYRPKPMLIAPPWYVELTKE